MGWVASYDVGDDRHRIALADLLGALGIRVLYSVFELETRPGWAQAAELAARAAPLLAGEDSLVLWPVCEQCRPARVGGSLEPEWGPAVLA